MAYSIPNSTGDAVQVHIIGDALKRPVVFTKDAESGTYNSYTGFTVSAVLYDLAGAQVATATVTVQDAVPPDETEVVADSQISIFIAPSALPTKAGNYVLVYTKTSDLNPNDVETFLRIRVVFERSWAIGA